MARKDPQTQIHTPNEFYCHACGRHTSSKTANIEEKDHKPTKSTKAPKPTATATTATKVNTVNTNPTPRKYCSQRCKKISKIPLKHAAAVWRDCLIVMDSRGRVQTGERDPILCVDVQPLVFDSETGREIGMHHEKRGSSEKGGLDESGVREDIEENGDHGEDGDIDAGHDTGIPSPSTSPRNPQQLGMVHARNRETVRSAARLIYHYGFEHFFTIETNGDKKQSDGTNTVDRSVAYPVEAMRRDGRMVTDVTHAKGEWGLRLKKR